MQGALIRVLGEHQPRPPVTQPRKMAEGGEHFLVLVLTRAVQRQPEAVADRRAREPAQVEVEGGAPLRDTPTAAPARSAVYYNPRTWQFSVGTKFLSWVRRSGGGFD